MAPLHQPVQQGQALLAIRHRLAAEQLEHPIGEQAIPFLRQLLAQAVVLAHALEQLLSLEQHLSGPLVLAFLLAVLGRLPAGQTRHQGEVGFTAAAEGGGLGGLETAAGQLEGLGSEACFPEEDQTADFTGGRNHQGRDRARVPLGDGRQFGLVALTTAAVGQEVGTLAKQLRPGFERLRRESIFRRSIEALLEGAENALGVDGRTDAQEAKVVDRQFQPKPLSAARL